MKLSFSIQNWKNMSWDEFCDVAEATRMQGIELYDIQGPVFRGKTSPSNPERAASTRRYLISKNLRIPCVNTVNDFTNFIQELIMSKNEVNQENLDLRFDHVLPITNCIREEQVRCSHRPRVLSFAQLIQD